MPGPIWQSVSFPTDRDITDSEINLFVAVLLDLFFVFTNLHDGVPRLWRELNLRAELEDAKLGLAPGVRPSRTSIDDQRCGSITVTSLG